jgi:hypothetical protein
MARSLRCWLIEFEQIEVLNDILDDNNTGEYTVKPCYDFFENSKKIWLLKQDIS